MEEMIESLETEVAKLKRLRTEDAKANEKVASIFATQEQNWFTEKKKLKLQIRALLAQFQAIERKKEAEIAGLNTNLDERNGTIRNREEELEVQSKKLRNLEEKLENLEEKLKLEEEAREELQRKHKVEVEEYTAELTKQKDDLAELISTKKQLEVEMVELARLSEESKAELEVVKEKNLTAEAVAEKLLEEVEKMRVNDEKKERVISAMLRKSKVATAEKKVLLKEVKAQKVRRKEAERLGKRRGGSSRVGQHSIQPECPRDRWRGQLRSRIRLLEYLDSESLKEEDDNEEQEEEDKSNTTDHLHWLIDGKSEEQLMSDVRQLQEWIEAETERYAVAVEERHNAEIEAFAEQLRAKDERMEVLRWQLLAMEAEMKRLRSHIEGLDGSLSRFGEDNVRLEALLMEKDKELRSWKDRFSLHMLGCRMKSLVLPQRRDHLAADVCLRRRSKVKEQERHGALVKDLLRRGGGGGEAYHEGGSHELSPEVKHVNSDSHSECCENHEHNLPAATRRLSFEGSVILQEDGSMEVMDEEKDKVVVAEFGDYSQSENNNSKVQKDGDGSGSKFPDLGAAKQHHINNVESTWKMDVHAIRVSYKIKRLKQQLAALEKLAGKDRNKEDDKWRPLKGFPLLMAMLNKQLLRYESLEEKTNDLCMRMHESQQDRKGKDPPNGATTKEEAERLEHSLEEAFQIQRYMVATGQKMMDIQSRITCSFIGGGGGGGGGGGDDDDFPGVDMGQFADIVRSLFRDVQRGFDVRIARIIGNIEGTLAHDGILHMRM